MKLNSLTIPEPKEMDVDAVEICVKRTTASGKKVKDVIAIKNNYKLSYQGLKSDSFIVFKNAYDIGEAVPFEYEDAEGTQTVNVYISTIPHSLFKLNPKLPQNITITLEEV
jgi:hypothetical protein